MNLIPQMSPIYWVFISMICYSNFLLMMILINTIFFKLDFHSIGVCTAKWNWLW